MQYWRKLDGTGLKVSGLLNTLYCTA